MKRFLSTVCLTVFFSSFFGKAQTPRTISIGGVPTVSTISTTPASTLTNVISQFQVEGSLITQNSFVNPSITGTQLTGSFANNARWNSMGNLQASPTSQILNGFRTQTDGKGLAWGHSVPNGGAVSDPFVEWIGAIPGKLNFNYAFSPTGAAAARIPAFTIEPNATSFSATAGANAYTNKGFIGQLQSGTFGSFGVGDTWSATGQITTPSFTTYGARQQYEGYTSINGLIKDNLNLGSIPVAVQDFGSNTNISMLFKFRSFTNATDPNSIKNVWQSSNKFSNVVFGRQNYGAVNSCQFYLSVFDGTASVASNTALNFVQRAGIYVTGDGTSALDGSQLSSYAAIVGDVSGVNGLLSSQKYGILGIADPNYTPGTSSNARTAGYFIGNLSYTGLLLSVSDKKFKTKINDEENILSKLMQLQPKNYYFDVEKYKNMAFDDRLQHGLISQEVEAVFPELVQKSVAPNTSKFTKEDGKPIEYKGLNYMGLIPMLLKGIQEQQVQIEELKSQLKSSTTNTFVIKDKTNLPAEIENKAFTLSQNTPNPFSEKTTISYTIPSNVKKATLAVFDLTGKMLLQYNLQAGKNTVAINGSTLPAGMYLYSLLADGQEVLSKRMILTK